MHILLCISTCHQWIILILMSLSIALQIPPHWINNLKIIYNVFKGFSFNPFTLQSWGCSPLTVRLLTPYCTVYVNVSYFDINVTGIDPLNVFPSEVIRPSTPGASGEKLHYNIKSIVSVRWDCKQKSCFFCRDHGNLLMK